MRTGESDENMKEKEEKMGARDEMEVRLQSSGHGGGGGCVHISLEEVKSFYRFSQSCQRLHSECVCVCMCVSCVASSYSHCFETVVKVCLSEPLCTVLYCVCITQGSMFTVLKGLFSHPPECNNIQYITL